MMWRCLSDLGGQSDLWADVDARTTRGVSVGARVGMDVPMWHTLSPHSELRIGAGPYQTVPYQWLTNSANVRKIVEGPGLASASALILRSHK